MSDRKQAKSPISGSPLPVGKPFKQGNEQRQTARKGGKASGEARRLKRSLRDELEMLLAEERTAGNGKRMSVQTGITSALVKQALDGNTRAYELIRDTLGQKPVQTVNVNTPDTNIMQEIRSFMKGKQNERRAK